MNASSIIALVLVVACMDAPTAPGVSAGTRVLFIGNSLTYVNDVPGLVMAIARQVGDNDLGTAMVAFPDFSLEDHWHEGSAARALGRQRWDFVVMQQGPSSLPANQLYLEEWTRQFDATIRSAAATPLLYQVWPHILRRGDAPAVLVSYANAARAVQGRLAPVGAAWDSVLASGDSVGLYSADGLHASAYGAWLAAVVIYATVRALDPATLPTTLPTSLPAQVSAPPLPAAKVRALLQRAGAAMIATRAHQAVGAAR
ncbi:MAG: hypothetical protein IT360_23300 [Gemmatimonadaceae bacterium]|nr:hypothetical protein [Gemmatimonadaceae bacterium]